MAYTATELLEARVFFENVASGKFQANELRRPVTNCTNSFINSTPFAVTGGASTIENLKKSGEQALKIPVQTKMVTDGGTARSCASATTESGSALTTLTYSTYTEGFYMSELLHANNDIDFQASLRHKLSEKMNILMQRLEANLCAYLESSASAVSSSTMGTLSSGVDTISLANKKEYFSRMTTAMMQNNFMPNYSHVHSMGLVNDIMLQQYEGAGNAANLSPQQDVFTHYAANLIPTTGSTSAASFVFVPGTVGLVNFNNKLHTGNAVSGANTWTTMANPFAPGLPFDLKITTGCTDNSGEATADLTTSFELVLQFARFKAYTSNTDTGIYKFQLANA